MLIIKSHPEGEKTQEVFDAEFALIVYSVIDCTTNYIIIIIIIIIMILSHWKRYLTGFKVFRFFLLFYNTATAWVAFLKKKKYIYFKVYYTSSISGCD